MSEKLPILIKIMMPFYPAPCPYDDRGLLPMEDPALLEAYVDALRGEIEGAAPDYTDCEVLAVKVSGGIAGHGADDKLGCLLRDMRHLFPYTQNTEVTLKVHPGMVSVDTLLACRRGGVTTLSVDYATGESSESEIIGRFLPPSVMDTTMVVLGKNHPSLSFDLYVGLPGQSKESLTRSLAKILAYGGQEIVLRPFLVKPGTPFAKEAQKLQASTSPRRHLPSEEEREALLEAAEAYLCGLGFVPGNQPSSQEGSRNHPLSFAREGHHSLFRSQEQKGCAQLGFGLSAVTTMDGIRATNTGSLDLYLRASDDPTKVVREVIPWK